MQQVNYNEISKIYDDVREGDIILVNHFLEEFPGSPRRNVLDIGCGTGNYTDLLQRITRTTGWQIYGIDPSEGMIEKARRKNRDIIFQQGKAETFSEVKSIDDLLGTYATDEAHAGAVKGGSAQAMTKGEVSLALAGKGAGVDIGVAFGGFTIKKK